MVANDILDGFANGHCHRYDIQYIDSIAMSCRRRHCLVASRGSDKSSVIEVVGYDYVAIGYTPGACGGGCCGWKGVTSVGDLRRVSQQMNGHTFQSLEMRYATSPPSPLRRCPTPPQRTCPSTDLGAAPHESRDEADAVQPIAKQSASVRGPETGAPASGWGRGRG
jgi:hypothetical protein